MATDSLGQLTVDLVANTGGFERGMDRAERKLAATERAFQRQSDAAERLVGQIDPVVGAMNRLVQQQSELERHAKAGIIPAGEFQRLNKILDDQLDAYKRGNSELMRTAHTAKQTAAALQGVPAQFTDIATSLAAGQNPLTVFLQQGGQLKDMFGGIVPAARALGGYVLGLVNPFTVAAAAAGVLALAYKQGSDEASAFTKAIVISGNAAGVTRDQLATSARGISESVGTVGAASEVLAKLTANGEIAAGSFDRIAIAALKMESATGKSVDETVKEFARLAKDPVNASRELNDQLNYLTAAQYEQIAATQEQGDTLGAAALAEQAYSAALTQRADEIKANLGSIESAWEFVKKRAKEGWDAILDVGREATLQEKLQQAYDIINAGNTPRGRTGRAQGLGLETRRDAEQAEQDIIALWADVAADGEKAFNAMTDRIVNERGIKGLELLRKEYDDTATTVDKLNKRLDNLRKAQEDAMSAGAWTDDRQRQFEQAADAIQRQIGEAQAAKPPRTPRERAFTEDAGMRMLNQLREQFAVLQAQTQETDKIGAAARALIQWEQQIADIKGKQTLTAEQKSLLANEELITAQLKRNAALEQEIEQRKDILKLEQDYSKLSDQLTAKGDKFVQQTKERLALLDRARAAGLVKTPEEFGRQQQQIVDLSTQPIPKVAGLDASVGGPFGEMIKLEQSAQEIEKWYQTQLDALAEYRETRSNENAKWDARELEVRAQHQQALAQLEQSRQVATLAGAESLFSNLSSLTAQFLGEESAAYKAIFLAQKSLAIAQTVINAEMAAAAALAPPPIGLGPVAGLPYSQLIRGIGYASAAVIGAQTAVGMAHDGIDAVPETGTWLLEKGERVTTAATSAKLDSTLNDIRSGRGGTTNNYFNLPNVKNGRDARDSTAAINRGVARGAAESGRYA